jgi:hypothetical protein
VGQRRYGYEAAFEDFLRTSRIPYVSVNEAQRTLRFSAERQTESLKSFDFVVYGAGLNLLVDIKGRRGAERSRGGWGKRLESWVTREDVAHLLKWESLFGAGFRGAFVFAYAFDRVPPDGLFAEVYPDAGLTGVHGWNALRVVSVREYGAAMRDRSPKWGTVELAPAEFERLWRPLGSFGVGERSALLGAAPAVA